MTLNDLRYILAVARERNFRRAAEQCFVTQPALSISVQKLEAELGVQIFERSKTDVSLTPVGVRIVEQAQRVVDEAAKIKALALEGQNPLAGPLRLGVIYTVGPYLLPDLIPALRKLAPDMPLEVEENTTANLEQRLKQGALDAIIIALPFGDGGIVTRGLYDEPFDVMVPAGHAWANKKEIKAKDLSTERVLLLDSGHCFSNQVAEACPKLSARGDTQPGNSLETIRNMVSSGLGITVLPSSATGDKYRSKLIQVIPFAKPVPSRRVALAWRKQYSRIAALDALAQAIGKVKIPRLEILRKL
jgi:LysR family transcriptional regulator, hydrogen peroxide-inducible genes activator